MKTLRTTIKIAIVSAGLALALNLCTHPAPAQKIVASIDISQTAAPVSNYDFGMFIEHIGKTMYGPCFTSEFGHYPGLSRGQATIHPESTGEQYPRIV